MFRIATGLIFLAFISWMLAACATVPDYIVCDEVDCGDDIPVIVE